MPSSSVVDCYVLAGVHQPHEHLDVNTQFRYLFVWLMPSAGKLCLESLTTGSTTIDLLESGADLMKSDCRAIFPQIPYDYRSRFVKLVLKISQLLFVYLLILFRECFKLIKKSFDGHVSAIKRRRFHRTARSGGRKRTILAFVSPHHSSTFLQPSLSVASAITMSYR